MATTNFSPAFVSNTPAGGKQIQQDMQKYAAGTPVDDLVTHAWLGVHMVADVIGPMATVTRASVLQGFNSLSSFDSMGLAPPVDFSKPSPLKATPRIYNTYVAFLVNDGSKFTWDGKLVSIAGAPDITESQG